MGLDRQPGAEFLASGITADTWCDAIWPGREWDRARDEPRIGAAFRGLCRTVRRWPTPAEFLEQLPRLFDRAQLRLPNGSHDERRRELAMRSMEEITQQFSWLRSGDA
jgi:hypothetical protein